MTFSYASLNKITWKDSAIQDIEGIETHRDCLAENLNLGMNKGVKNYGVRYFEREAGDFWFN